MATHFKVMLAVLVVGVGFVAFILLKAPSMPAGLFQGNVAIEKSVINNAKKSIVALYSAAPYGMRSGLILDKDGLVVTFGSTIQQKNVISGHFQGGQVSLKNLHIANDNLAVLRMTVSGDLPIAEFADESKIKVGQKVFLVSATSTNQDEWIVSEGNITQASSEVISTDITGIIEMSSSPMFNAAGQLVGIAYPDVNGKISAIPVSKLMAFKNL